MKDDIYVIIGGSSTIGTKISKRLLADGKHVIATVNNNPINIENKMLTTYKIDFGQPNSVELFSQFIAPYLNNSDSRYIIFSIGAWHCGYVSTLKESDFIRTITLNLKIQILLTASILGITNYENTHLFYLTGSTDNNNSVGNSLYGICCNGIRFFIKSLNAEIIARSFNSSCAGFSFGLFDKGQPYLKEVLEKSNLELGASFDDFADFITELFRPERCRLLNGSFTEINNGIPDFSLITKWYLNKYE